MPSDKAMYWIAACVLAFGLTNGYVTEHTGWLDRITDGSTTLAERATEVAMRYADKAEMRLEHNAFSRTQMAIVRARADIACVQGTLARRQGEMARVQAERIRTQAMKREIREFVACPRQQVIIADNTL